MGLDPEPYFHKHPHHAISFINTSVFKRPVRFALLCLLQQRDSTLLVPLFFVGSRSQRTGPAPYPEARLRGTATQRKPGVSGSLNEPGRGTTGHRELQPGRPSRHPPQFGQRSRCTPRLSAPSPSWQRRGFKACPGTPGGGRVTVVPAAPFPEALSPRGAALGVTSRTDSPYLGRGARAAAAPRAGAAAAAGPRRGCPSAAGGSTGTERGRGGLGDPEAAGGAPRFSLALAACFCCYPSRPRPVGKELAGTPFSVGFTKI